MNNTPRLERTSMLTRPISRVLVGLCLIGLASEIRGQERRGGSGRRLGDLMKQPPDAASRWIPNLPRVKVDDARAAELGIRKLAGKRLILYTDLPPGPQVDQLTELFDQAFPQWCKYFRLDPAKHAEWKMTGFLMKQKEPFQQAGLLPEELPAFKHGFSRNYELWSYDQTREYYRRHLLLHEGTHGLMNTVLGSCGPPWYMEGVAEMLATHRWDQGRLTLGYFPADRKEVLGWERIRLVKDAIARRQARRFDQVIDYSLAAHLDVEPYAWCWAAATLLERHPRYRDRFRELPQHLLKRDFSRRFRRMMEDDWHELREEWQLFVTGLEYGYDIPGTVIDFTPGKPLPPAGSQVDVEAKGGWQNSGLVLAADATYRLKASGRYQVADQPQIWWCEPGGVSIRYYQGRPLGILLAAVRGQQETAGSSALLRPIVVGLQTTVTPKQTGTLYLKINDSAAELHDNAGRLKVEITVE